MTFGNLQKSSEHLGQCLSLKHFGNVWKVVGNFSEIGVIWIRKKSDVFDLGKVGRYSIGLRRQCRKL